MTRCQDVTKIYFSLPHNYMPYTCSTISCLPYTRGRGSKPDASTGCGARIPQLVPPAPRWTGSGARISSSRCPLPLNRLGAVPEYHPAGAPCPSIGPCTIPCRSQRPQLSTACHHTAQRQCSPGLQVWRYPSTLMFRLAAAAGCRSAAHSRPEHCRPRTQPASVGKFIKCVWGEGTKGGRTEHCTPPVERSERTAFRDGRT